MGYRGWKRFCRRFGVSMTLEAFFFFAFRLLSILGVCTSNQKGGVRLRKSRSEIAFYD